MYMYIGRRRRGEGVCVLVALPFIYFTFQSIVLVTNKLVYYSGIRKKRSAIINFVSSDSFFNSCTLFSRLGGKVKRAHNSGE